MISTASAVPQAHSGPVMNVLNSLERKILLLEERGASEIKEKLADLLDALPLGPLLDLIKKIILLLIMIINELIRIIIDLFNIAQLIAYLIERILVLIALIIAFIEWLIDIFTPGII
jgi:hypothetical protein